MLAAIDARKPVFCEKPLATTAAASLSSSRPTSSWEGISFRSASSAVTTGGYRALKKTIDEGVIGARLMIHCAHRNPTVPEAYVSDMAIVDTFIHEIDALRWLIGDDYVSAQVIVQRNSRHTHAKLDDPIIVLLATRSGVRIDGEVFVNCRYGYDI